MNVLGADPYILFDEKSGYYYCYATSNSSEEGQFYIYKSTDLINWKFVGYALNTKINSWAKDWFWAPECYFNPNNGYYYLFYSAVLKNELVEHYFANPNYIESAKIGVAVSKSPEGPFININDRPMDYYPYDPEYYDIDCIFKNVFAKEVTLQEGLKAPRGTYLSSIDVNLFFDKNKIFMYYSRCCYHNCVYDKELKKYIEESNILGVELNTEWWFDKNASMMPTIKNEFIGFNKEKNRREDKFVNIINYQSQPQKWENGHVYDYETFSKRNRRWSEGSTTFKRIIDGKEKYCITYSCNNFENALYGVGIAFGDEPLGKYTKYEQNPIIHQISEQSLYSTGHGTIIEKDGNTYYFFHGRDSIEKDRTLYIGKLDINSLDDIKVSDIIHCKLIK